MTRASAGAASTFSLLATYDTTPLQLLGAHEFYWWPEFNMLMTRCRDEDNWYALRITKDYEAIVGTPGSYDDITHPEKISARQVALFGKLTLHPIFVDDLAFFYVTDTAAGTGSLRVYKYHEDIEYLEYQDTEFTFTETSTDYLDYSLFYLGEEQGVVCGIPQSATSVTYTRVVYNQDDGSSTNHNPTVDTTYAAEFSNDLTKLHFLQARQSPDNPENDRALYAYYDNTKISKIYLDTSSNSDGIFKVESEIEMPAEGYFHDPMNADIGPYHIVVMSKADCDDYTQEAAPTSTSLIT